jgi:hypothetical protein
VNRSDQQMLDDHKKRATIRTVTVFYLTSETRPF